MLESGAFGASDTVANLAAASKVVLRLSMLTGDETIELPQTDQGFRALVSPCIEKSNAQREKVISDQKASEERQAREVQRQIASGPVNAM